MTNNRGGNKGSEKWIRKTTATTDGLIGAVHGSYVYMGCVRWSGWPKNVTLRREENGYKRMRLETELFILTKSCRTSLCLSLRFSFLYSFVSFYSIYASLRLSMISGTSFYFRSCLPALCLYAHASQGSYFVSSNVSFSFILSLPTSEHAILKYR